MLRDIFFNFKHRKDKVHNISIAENKSHIGYKNLTRQDMILNAIEDLTQHNYDDNDELKSIEIIYNHVYQDKPQKSVFLKRVPYIK